MLLIGTFPKIHNKGKYQVKVQLMKELIFSFLVLFYMLLCFGVQHYTYVFAVLFHVLHKHSLMSRDVHSSRVTLDLSVPCVAATPSTECSRRVCCGIAWLCLDLCLALCGGVSLGCLGEPALSHAAREWPSLLESW